MVLNLERNRVEVLKLLSQDRGSVVFPEVLEVALNLFFHLLLDVSALVERRLPDIFNHVKPGLEPLFSIASLVASVKYFLEVGHHTSEDSDSKELQDDSKDHLSLRGREVISIPDSREGSQHEIHGGPQPFCIVFIVARTYGAEISLARRSAESELNYEESVLLTVDVGCILNVVREAVPD